eukprot:1830840-Rhodomonas_salina.5
MLMMSWVIMDDEDVDDDCAQLTNNLATHNQTLNHYFPQDRDPGRAEPMAQRAFEESSKTAVSCLLRSSNISSTGAVHARSSLQPSLGA